MSTPEYTPSSSQPVASSETAAESAAPYNVLAVVGFALSFFNSISGAVLGFMALSQIKKTAQRGRGFALAAVIISFGFLALRIILAIIVLIFLAVVFARASTDPSFTELYSS